MGALAVKVPASAALVWGVPALGLPALGVVGCGIATAIAMWSQAAVAWWVVRRDPFYERFALAGRGLDRPDRRALAAHLKLGLPMGASILIEVSGFSFMALFISRLGTTPAAGHQIAVNRGPGDPSVAKAVGQRQLFCRNLFGRGRTSRGHPIVE